MKQTLTLEDKKILLDLGYEEKDFPQISRSLTYTDYSTRLEGINLSLGCYNNKRNISADDAIEILGIEDFLSGLARSTFHYDAVRENADGKRVYFNSRRLWNRFIPPTDNCNRRKRPRY